VYKKQRDSGKLIETAEIILKYNKSVSTNLTYAQMIGLARLAGDIPEDGVHFFSIPGHCRTINNISYWVPDENETKKLTHAFGTM
jgi:anionic cell wall polymer biosynthesis LytR-Cps2A-Psr (LCP) family protein